MRRTIIIALVILALALSQVAETRAQTATPTATPTPSENCMTLSSSSAYGGQRIVWPDPPFITTSDLPQYNDITLAAFYYPDLYIRGISGSFDFIYGNATMQGNSYVTIDEGDSLYAPIGSLVFHYWTASGGAFTAEFCASALPSPPTPTVRPVSQCAQYTVSGSKSLFMRETYYIRANGVHFHRYSGEGYVDEDGRRIPSGMEEVNISSEVYRTWASYGGNDGPTTFYSNGEVNTLSVCGAPGGEAPTVRPTATPVVPYGCGAMTIPASSMRRTITNTSTTVNYRVSIYRGGPVHILDSTGATDYGPLPNYNNTQASGYVVPPGYSFVLVDHALNSVVMVCSQIAATPSPIASMTPLWTTTPTGTQTNTPTVTQTPIATINQPPCPIMNSVNVPVSPGTASVTLQFGVQFSVAGASVWFNMGSGAQEVRPGSYTWDQASGTYVAYSLTTPATVWVCAGASAGATVTSTSLPTPSSMSEPPIATAACVPLPSLTATIAFALPDLSLSVPTMRPSTPTTTGTITSSIPLSTTEIVGFIGTVQAGLATPMGAMQTASAGYSWASGASFSATASAGATGAMSWLSVLNPVAPAWTLEGGPLWALSPAIMPILPIIGFFLLAAIARFLLWLAAGFLKLLDLLIKVIELIPGE